MKTKNDVRGWLTERPCRHEIDRRAARHHDAFRAAAQILLCHDGNFAEFILQDEGRLAVVRLPQHVVIAVFCKFM